MIFVDSDVFLIDLRYRRDPRFPENREFLERLQRVGRGVTTIFNLLEICGVLSFNLNRQQLWELFHYFPQRYGVRVRPRAVPVWLPRVRVRELLEVMERRAAFGDALILAYLERAGGIELVVSWNARHFVGRVGIEAVEPPAVLERLREEGEPNRDHD